MLTSLLSVFQYFNSKSGTPVLCGTVLTLQKATSLLVIKTKPSFITVFDSFIIKRRIELSGGFVITNVNLRNTSFHVHLLGAQVFPQAVCL